MNRQPVAESDGALIEHGERNVLLITYVLYGLLWIWCWR